MYMDYLSGELTGDYSSEQYFDLYLYADLLGLDMCRKRPCLHKLIG